MSGIKRLIDVDVGKKYEQSQSRYWKTRIVEEVSQYRLLAVGSNEEDPLEF